MGASVPPGPVSCQMQSGTLMDNRYLDEVPVNDQTHHLLERRKPKGDHLFHKCLRLGRSVLGWLSNLYPIGGRLNCFQMAETTSQVNNDLG